MEAADTPFRKIYLPYIASKTLEHPNRYLLERCHHTQVQFLVAPNQILSVCTGK
jgi:hypothetical protein